MLVTRFPRKSGARVATGIAAGIAAVVALVLASGACGSFSSDDPNAADGGDASSADATLADGSTGADGPTSSDAATDGADAGIDTGAARHLRVFVLTTTWNDATAYLDGGANLFGRESADDFCADEGSAAGLGARFYAFVSLSTSDAIDRLPIDADWSLPNAGSPILVFASHAAIDVATPPLHALDRNARGELLTDGETRVWTGTGSNGRATADTCGDWGLVTSEGTTGRTNSVGSWSNASPISCDQPLHVFCFGY